MSRHWTTTFAILYRVLTWLGPLVRPLAESIGIGNIVELVVVGRRTGRPRVVLLGLLRVRGQWYLGHPNGATNWTRNLDAAGEATLLVRGAGQVTVRPVLLERGEERTRVIGVTWHQHVFPGSLVYWLARRHIVAVGRYYRMEPLSRPGAVAES